MESGNKLVIEARLKGSGMHWAEPLVDAMLAIRNIICSDRWKEEWPKAEYQPHQQTRLRRTQLHRSQNPSPPLPLSPPKPMVDDRVPQALSDRLEQSKMPQKRIQSLVEFQARQGALPTS